MNIRKLKHSNLAYNEGSLQTVVPEKRLAVAILTQAISDLFDPRVGKVNNDQARTYIECDLMYPLSFSWICDALGYAEDLMRNEILTASKPKLKQIVRDIRMKIHG